MAITIGVERLTRELLAELQPLFEQHRDELTTDKALMVLAPDVDRYLAAEESGIFLALVARDDGRTVGYSGNFVTTNLHYSALCYCHNDVLFLDNGHRKGTLGLKLMAMTEREAAARKARLMIWHAKSGSTLEKLLPRRGYKVQDVLFSKRL